MKSTLELLPAMSANPWFGALPLRERRAMLGDCELRRLRAGEMLFRQGDRVPPAAGAFYGLVTGAFKISSLREDGKEAILAVLEAGNWFGEISLLDQQPRTHDATALGEAEVLVLPRAAFNGLMERHAFARAICRLLAARTLRSTAWWKTPRCARPGRGWRGGCSLWPGAMPPWPAMRGRRCRCHRRRWR